MIMMLMLYDTIIIGGGPAALTAAIYAARRALKVLVLMEAAGGQMATADWIENYPGVEKVSGPVLTERFLAQAKRFGAEIIFTEATMVEKKRDSTFNIKTAGGEEYPGKSLILAFGETPKHLGVPGEDEFRNKGVFYCATCDAPLFAGKKVAVVGGGNSALEAAVVLADLASEVYLIHRSDKFKGEEILVQRVRQNKKIKFMPNKIIKAIKGSRFVEEIILQEVAGKAEEAIKVEGVFVEIGLAVKTDLVKDLVKLNPAGKIIVDKFAATSMKGVFAAGDVTDVPYQQIVISSGEGAKAALSAYAYLKGRTLDQEIESDWGPPGGYQEIEGEK